MSKLKQLPITGDWIDPGNIAVVHAYDGEKFMRGCESMPRTVVVLSVGGQSSISVIECEAGIQQARKIRDEIAGWANEKAETP